jgi:hypothetical protein
MMKLTEKPVALVNQKDGSPLVFPEQYAQRQQVGLAVFSALQGDSARLVQILTEHGFDQETTEFLVGCIVPKRRGRPKGSDVLWLYAQQLDVIKKSLRDQGHSTWGIHKKAMELLESGAPVARAKLAEYGVDLPPLNRDQLEAFIRRSKKLRPRKSRAKYA